jgi:hypothetical protein
MMERFMMIEESWDPRASTKWTVWDVADGKGTRAVTFGLGLDIRRIKKAAIVLVSVLAVLWLFHFGRLICGVALVFYGLWLLELFGTHKVLYRVIQNPKDSLWYVIGNAGPTRNLWIPCSEGFKSQIEAILDARQAREKYDG